MQGFAPTTQGRYDDEDDVMQQEPAKLQVVHTPPSGDDERQLKVQCYALTDPKSTTRLEEAKALFDWASEPVGFKARAGRGITP